MANGTNPAYAPVAPLTAAAAYSLSDDFIYTSNLLADLESSSPLATFMDDENNPQALFVSPDGNLWHLVPSSGTGASSWSVSEISSAGNITGVAAGMQLSDGSIHAFYDNGTNIHHIELTEGGWEPAGTLPTATALRVTTNPEGALIAYGADASGGALVLMTQSASSGNWVSTSIPIAPGALSGGDPLLVITDQDNDWFMAVASGTDVNVFSGTATTMMTESSIPTGGAAANQVLAGYLSPEAQQGDAVLFVFTDTSDNVYWAVANQGTATAIPNLTATSAAAMVDVKHDLHLYLVDAAGTLTALHQTSWTAGQPVFTPYIPMRGGNGQAFLDSVTCDVNPLDSAALFGLDPEGALWFISQDPKSKLWTMAEAQQPGSSDQAYRVPQYRTQISVTDANSNPAPNVILNVTASTMTAIASAGNVQFVGPGQSVPFVTDGTGRVTLTTIAGSLATAQLTVTADGLASTMTINPAGNVHGYLTGNGPINPGSQNPLDTFSASTVTSPQYSSTFPNASTGNAGVVVNGISSVLSGQGTNTNPSDAKIAGWAVDLRDRAHPRYHTFHTPEEVDAYRDRLIADVAADAPWWLEPGEFCEEIWEGLKSAAISAYSWVQKVGDDFMTVAIAIGDAVNTVAQLVVKGIEDVISAVHSMLSYLGALLDKIIDWLKMLFNFGAIIDTKDAMLSSITTLCTQMGTAATTYAGLIGTGGTFFQDLKSDIDGWFQQGITNYGSTTLASLAQSSSSAAAKGLGPRIALGAPSWVTGLEDFLQGVEHNWLVEKVLSFFETFPNSQTVDGLSELGTQVTNAIGDLVTTFGTFASNFENDLDPETFGALTVGTILSQMQALVDGLLKVLDDVIQAMLTVVAGGAALVGTVMATQLFPSFLSGILKVLGIDVSSITVAQVFCLALAVPVTLFYEIVTGNEPFPGGKLPDPSAASDGVSAYTLAGAVLTVFYSIFNFALDINTELTNVAFAIIEIVMSALIAVFTWPGGVPGQSSPSVTVYDMLNWWSGVMWIAFDMALLCVPDGDKWPPGPTIARYDEPVGKVLLIIAGGVQLAVGVADLIGDDANGDPPDAGAIGDNLLSPMSNLFQFLRLDALNNPSTLFAKAMIDIFAGVGSGLCIAIE